MPVGINEVTIEATTDSEMCAIVSVQNVTVSFAKSIKLGLL